MGDVVNLVSVDVQRLVESTMYLNGLWMTSIWMTACFVYLWQVCRSSETPGRGYQWHMGGERGILPNTIQWH